MIRFPIDPTPYVILYAIVVFVLPWIITLYYVLRANAYIHNNPQLPGYINYNGISIIARLKAVRTLCKASPVIAHLNSRVIRWATVTIAAWLIGFAMLGGTLWHLNNHDLLIDHSRGLYGPNELHQKQSSQQGVAPYVAQGAPSGER